VGVLAAAAAVALFFLALRLDGWYWPDFGVPGGTGLYFLDLRFITSAWECIRRGIDVIPAIPCDPRARTFNYPRAWLVPAPLGLGQEDTVRLGKALVVTFFLTAFVAMGRARLADGLVSAAAMCSPAVMLGVERGNADLLIFCLVVWGVLLLRLRSAVPRIAAHALLWLSAVLKLYPVFAWAPLLWQRRRWVLGGAGVVGLGFAAYALATLDDLRRVRETVPRDQAFSYGAPILGEKVGGNLVVLAAGAAIAIALVALARRRRADPSLGEQRELDLFLAGAATFVGTFALGHNYNYRMVFLLLTLPLLLRWARGGDALAAIAGAGVVATMWLGTSQPVFGLGEWWAEATASFPYDELLNVALVSYLAAGVFLVLADHRREIAVP
jgi:hypothetical protein